MKADGGVVFYAGSSLTQEGLADPNTGNPGAEVDYLNVSSVKIRAESLGSGLDSGSKLGDLPIGAAELVESTVNILNEGGTNSTGETGGMGNEENHLTTTISVTNPIRTDRQIRNGEVVEKTVSAKKDTVVKIEDVMKVFSEKIKNIQINKYGLVIWNMKKNIRIILVLLIASISCRREANRISGKENQEKKQENIIEYAIFYPDTVQKNLPYKGYILFKTDFDTLEIEQGDRRFTFYYAQIAEDVEKSYTLVKNQELDTFGALNNEEIPFEFKFDKLGNNFVDGFLEDQIILPTEDSTEVRLITLDARITFKVFVVDSTTTRNPDLKIKGS